MAISLSRGGFTDRRSAGIALSRAHWLERGLAAFILFVAATPFFDLFNTSSYGSILTQATWACLYLLALALLTAQLKTYWIVWTARHLLAVVFVLVVILLSSFWTLDPSLTLRRSFSLVGTCLVGLYLGLRFSPADLMRILSWTLLLLVALSVIAVVAAPGYGIADHAESDGVPGAWKGILHHKQTMGAVAAYGAIVCVATLTSKASHRLAYLVGLIVCVSVVVMARSVTALAGFMVAISVVVSLLFMRQFRFPILGAFVIVTYGAVVVALVVLTLVTIEDFSVLTGLVGRDATLTGRLSTWHDALGMLGDRPLGGFGYEAVWGLGSATHLPQFLKSGIASHAHNGYLNLATQVGLPAAVVAVGFLLVTFFRAMREYFVEPSTFLAFAIGYVAMFITENMSRSILFAYQQFEWVLFMAVSVMVVRTTLSRSRSMAYTSARPPLQAHS